MKILKQSITTENLTITLVPKLFILQIAIAFLFLYMGIGASYVLSTKTYLQCTQPTGFCTLSTTKFWYFQSNVSIPIEQISNSSVQNHKKFFDLYQSYVVGIVLRDGTTIPINLIGADGDEKILLSQNLNNYLYGSGPDFVYSENVSWSAIVGLACIIGSFVILYFLQMTKITGSKKTDSLSIVIVHLITRQLIKQYHLKITDITDIYREKGITLGAKHPSYYVRIRTKDNAVAALSQGPLFTDISADLVVNLLKHWIK